MKSKTYVTKSKRKKGGLYLYEQQENKGIKVPLKGLSNPYKIKVAV